MSKRGKINPLTGITDGKMNGYIRSALRKLWSHNVGKMYERSVRYKKGGRFHVRCVSCGLEMWVGAKKIPLKKDGSLSKKRPQKLFDLDHVDGTHPLIDPIYDLGAFWISLMTGRLQILCKECHSRKTSEQTTERAKNTTVDMFDK